MVGLIGNPSNGRSGNGREWVADWLRGAAWLININKGSGK